MSSERDIDDILDSLNQLLREGESHNDDHVETDEVSESDPQADEAALQEFEQASAPAENEELPAEVEVAEPETEAEPEMALEPADSAAEPDFEPQEQSETDHEDEAFTAVDESPLSMQRVVLTEEMLVDNPQGSLLSLVRAAEANVAARPSEAGEGGVGDQQGEQVNDANGPLHVDHEHMGRLLEQLSDDVINRLRQELPVLIRDSLYRHLGELNSEHRERTGETEEQRSAQQQIKESKRDE